MKKLMILVAMLAMMLEVAGPASADDLDGDELLVGIPAFSVIDEWTGSALWTIQTLTVL